MAVSKWILATCILLVVCIWANSADGKRHRSKNDLALYQEKENDNDHQQSDSSQQYNYVDINPDKPKAPVNKTEVTCRDASQHHNSLFEICPKFVHELKNVTQAVGRLAKFDCVVDHLGRFKVAWMRISTSTILGLHNSMISENRRITVTSSQHRTYSLHIKNIRESDAGPYMCQVNTVPMFYRIGYLEVVVPPDIIESETSTDINVNEGANIKMKCAASGHPEPTYTWRREDNKTVQLGNWQKSQLVQNLTIYEGPVLEIKKVSRLQMGAYLCIASNGVPPAVSRRMSLSVNFAPMMWVPNQLIGAPVGGNVTLECTSEAFPDSLNYWSRIKDIVVSDINENGRMKAIFRIMSYKVHMLLIIYPVMPSDFGLYQCFAKNSLGTTEGTIRLYEIHPPQPIKEPSTAQIHRFYGYSENPPGPTPPRDDADYSEETNKVAVEDVTETSSMLKPKKDYLDNKAGSLAARHVVFLVCTMLVLPLMFRRGT